MILMTVLFQGVVQLWMFNQSMKESQRSHVATIVKIIIALITLLENFINGIIINLINNFINIPLISLVLSFIIFNFF